MRHPEISVVSLDGLNNNGKTTQVEYLQRELVGRDIPTIVRRGDGSRKGTGLSESDPVSDWWQENYKLINSAGLEGPEAEAAARMASNRLMQELWDLKTDEYPRELKARGEEQGVILLDRGPVSRLFVARRYNPDATFNDAFQMGEDLSPEDILPDEILVLHTTKEKLLARNLAREDGAPKQEFNGYIIGRYYDAFERVLDNMPPQLSERMTIIDSGFPVQEVGATALALVMERL